MSGNVKKFIKEKGYESLNRSMLQDEDNLSLQAIGLLANLTSYSDTWVIHKTELYNRFAKNKRKSVQNAWAELVENNYIVQLRKRNGSKYDYIYYHSQIPFDENDIKEIEEYEGVPIWNGKTSKDDKDNVYSSVPNEQSNKKQFSNVPFEQSKTDCPKGTDKRSITNEVYHKDLDTSDTGNQNINNAENKEKKRERLIQKARRENSNKIPEQLAEVLNTFSNSEEEENNYYKIILQAKNKASLEVNLPLTYEDYPELANDISNIFIRSLQRIQKSNDIVNPNGYIYNAITQNLIEKYKIYDTDSNSTFNLFKEMLNQ